MKKLLFILVIGLSLFGFFEQNPNLLQPSEESRATSDQQLTNVFEKRQSDVQVGGAGVVIHLLPDDTKGSQHQRFLMKLSSGQKLLIAHNIDLAPRIEALRKGDTVEFYGEYEWNAKGGVVHWTHRDPRGRHKHGWLKHNGVTYD